jgi:hypothetical protein
MRHIMMLVRLVRRYVNNDAMIFLFAVHLREYFFNNAHKITPCSNDKNKNEACTFLLLYKEYFCIA